MGTAVVASASCGLGMAAEHNLKIKALTTATAGPPPKILDRKDPCGANTFWLHLEIFVPKRYQQVKIQKKGTYVVSILKVDKTLVPLFFLFFYSLVSKIEICVKYVFEKIP